MAKTKEITTGKRAHIWLTKDNTERLQALGYFGNGGNFSELVNQLIAEHFEKYAFTTLVESFQAKEAIQECVRVEMKDLLAKHIIPLITNTYITSQINTSLLSNSVPSDAMHHVITDAVQHVQRTRLGLENEMNIETFLLPQTTSQTPRMEATERHTNIPTQQDIRKQLQAQLQASTTSTTDTASDDANKWFK